MLTYKIKITQEKSGRWMIRQDGRPLRTGRKIRSYPTADQAQTALNEWQNGLHQKGIKIDLKTETVPLPPRKL